jgi:hypothetical protein
VGNTPKNVDEKMLMKNCSQHSEKCYGKILTTVKKNKKSQNA